MGFQAISEGLKQKKEEFEENPRDTVKQHWGVLAASSIFLLALYLRYMPAQGMQYLQSLDPYWIFRQSQHLALEGNIPTTDFMRYFPYNAPFQQFNNGDIVIPAVMYWLGPALVFKSYMSWAQFYPALMGAFGVFATYFLGKELHDRHTGVFAAFFLATVPGVLHRTSAGFFEKEPLGSFFMILSMYFFTRAWRREETWAGVLSGLSLGLFTVSWGGSKFTWLLYPLVVGIVMMLNEDIKKLVTTYTPTVLIGGGFAAAMNPSRFWITGSIFLGNLALLAFLWSRYLVEELDLVSDSKLPYYTPAVSLTGLVLAALSPLYSNFIASKFLGLLSIVTRDTGGVIAGTVAENTAASLTQLVGQLGAASSANIATYLTGPLAVLRPFANILAAASNLVGAWQLGFIGIVLSGTYVLAMLLRKFDVLGSEVDAKTYHSMIVSVLFGWVLVFALFFQDNIIVAVGPSILALLGGIGIVRGLEESRDIEIKPEWYRVLPLAWAITGILGAVTMSRLIFLSAFPAAFMAGYAFSKAWKRLKSMSQESVTMIGVGGAVLFLDLLLILVIGTITSLSLLIALAVVASLNGLAYYLLNDVEDAEWLERLAQLDVKKAVLVTVMVITVAANFSAGFVNINSMGGSPNSLWMDNLEYMEEETPEGSVILSWWDYGYWFESIGRRAAIADGGNNGYYSSGPKINLPLADFLTSSNPGNYTDFLEKHSVDYVVLDESMIGKYQAVSQISNRDNSEFTSMLQLSTSDSFQRSLSRDSQNNTVVQFSRGRLGLYLPVEISSGGVEIINDTAPTIEARSRGKVDCVLTPEGRKEYDVEATELPGGLFGTDSSPTEVCVAINPYYSMDRSLGAAQAGRGQPAKAVLVPKDISRSTLVRLYLMDGHDLEQFEKVEEGSPYGFVKMWKVVE